MKRRKTTIRRLASKSNGRIRLNAKDIAVMADLGEYGLLDSQLCHSRHFAEFSREWCRQKLARLAVAGLVRSIKLQVWYAEHERTSGGRIPTIHFLTENGAEAVRQWTGSYPKRVLRSDPAPATIFHRLQIAKVRTAFDSDAQAIGLPIPFWTMEQDLRPDVAEDIMPNQRRWLYHEFRTADGLVTCRPDAAALIQIPNPSQPHATNLGILFEIDLSREGLDQCRDKLDGFAALIENRVFPYWPQLENRTIRVFWIVPSAQRIKQLAGCFKNHTIADIFRFTTFANCGPGLLTSPVWRDVQGEERAIYRPNVTYREPYGSSE
jgi:hypothetical protein